VLRPGEDSKGLFRGIYLDGQNSDESWEAIAKWKEFQHPFWKTEGEIAKKLDGHGGLDYIMLYRLLQCIREGLPPGMDVYDVVAWSSVAPSVSLR